MEKIYFKEWRQYAGLNQIELAQLLNTTPPTVSRIETGKRDFSGSYLFAFAKVCGCTTPGDPVSRPPGQISLDSEMISIPKEYDDELRKRIADLLAIFKKRGTNS
jgi:transcriptional regulator with XRE-family HTH domain